MIETEVDEIERHVDGAMSLWNGGGAGLALEHVPEDLDTLGARSGMIYEIAKDFFRTWHPRRDGLRLFVRSHPPHAAIPDDAIGTAVLGSYAKWSLTQRLVTAGFSEDVAEKAAAMLLSLDA